MDYTEKYTPRVIPAEGDVTLGPKQLAGTFAWTLTGFAQADSFILPETKNPQPAPPDGPFQNPEVMFGYKPPTADLKNPSGYYPFASGGYITFVPDGTFTGAYRVNMGGNTVPWDVNQPMAGTYVVVPDGTVNLLFADNDGAFMEWFLAIVDPNEEMLAVVTWVSRSHRRVTATGVLKRSRYNSESDRVFK